MRLSAVTASSASESSTASCSTRRSSASSAAGSPATLRCTSARCGRVEGLAAPAAAARACRRDVVRVTFELVGQGLERRRVAEAVGESLREHPVGEPGVARKKRSVEIGADGTTDAAALVPALAVVAEAGDDATEWLGAAVEVCAAGVVLETRERGHHAGLELALEQDVADHARLAGVGHEREEADAGEIDSVEVTVQATHELVAAADSE